MLQITREDFYHVFLFAYTIENWDTNIADRKIHSISVHTDTDPTTYVESSLSLYIEEIKSKCRLHVLFWSLNQIWKLLCFWYINGRILPQPTHKHMYCIPSASLEQVMDHKELLVMFNLILQSISYSVPTVKKRILLHMYKAVYLKEIKFKSRSHVLFWSLRNR